MSISPVTGNGIAMTLPLNKVVFWSVLVQSSANQFVQVRDSKGNSMFTAQGASSSGGTPTQVDQGIFQVRRSDADIHGLGRHQ